MTGGSGSAACFDFSSDIHSVSLQVTDKAGQGRELRLVAFPYTAKRSENSSRAGHFVGKYVTMTASRKASSLWPVAFLMGLLRIGRALLYYKRRAILRRASRKH